MKFARLVVVLFSIWLMAALGSADVQMVWIRTDPGSDKFTHTAVDESNNVYCLGTQLLGDMIVLRKYSSAGVIVWSHYVSTPPPIPHGYSPKALSVDSAGNCYYLQETEVSANRFRGYLTKVNANGSLGWTNALEAPTGEWLSLFAGKLVLDAAQKPCVAYYRWGTTSGGQWRFRRYRADGTIEHAAITGSSLVTGVVDDMVVTAEGRPIWRFGKRAQDGIPHTSTIQAYPFFSYAVTMPHAFRIAYTSRLGGYLYGVGMSDLTHAIVYRMSIASGVTTSQTFAVSAFDTTGSGTTSMKIEEAIADPNGNLHVIGKIKPVAYAERGHRWVIKFDDLSLMANSQFIGGYLTAFAPDRFGSIVSSSNSWLDDIVGVGAFDMNTLLTHNGGYSTAPVPLYQSSDVAVNSKGFAAMVGRRNDPTSASVIGVVWFVRQVGVRNVTVPAPEITGGQSILATVNRYYAAATAETLAFSSDTGFAMVSGSITIPAGSSATTIPVTLNPSTVDRFVNLTATDSSERQARKVQFILKAPRPSSLTLTPSTVLGGSPSVGRVTLTGPAPSGGIRVTLATTSASFIIIPASVVVPAGQTAVNFPIATAEVPTTNAGNISATYIGVTKHATLTVTP